MFKNIFKNMRTKAAKQGDVNTKFVRIDRKFKIAEIEQFETDTLNNVLIKYNCTKTHKQIIKDTVTGVTLDIGIHGFEAVSKMGKPNVTMQGYENSPGAWVFEHTTGIILVIFSDGHRKNCYKGTSYELANIPDDFDDVLASTVYRDIKELITRL